MSEPDSVSVKERYLAFRRAADNLRVGETDVPHAVLIDLVADWIEAEAEVWHQLEPAAEIFNWAVAKTGGPEDLIRFARTESGEMRVSVDTSEHAVAIIEAAS